MLLDEVGDPKAWLQQLLGQKRTVGFPRLNLRLQGVSCHGRQPGLRASTAPWRPAVPPSRA